MAIRVIIAGATGWTGSALVKGVLGASDMELVGAVARTSAGQDVGAAVGLKPVGLAISSSLEDALMKPCDVVVDYTKPNVVKQHALATIGKGVAFVVGTSGLSAKDYAEIDSAAKAKGVGVFAAGNFSITATLLAKFAVMAAKYIPDVEVVDYASAGKPDVPSGTCARARRAPLGNAPPCDLEAGRRARRSQGDARRDHRRGAGAFVAHAGFRAFLRGRVRRAR